MLIGNIQYNTSYYWVKEYVNILYPLASDEEKNKLIKKLNNSFRRYIEYHSIDSFYTKVNNKQKRLITKDVFDDYIQNTQKIKETKTMSTIITVALQKGGVSKTASCMLLADYLVSKGKKVLLIDGDVQATLTCGMMKLEYGSGVPKESHIERFFDGEDVIPYQYNDMIHIIGNDLRMDRYNSMDTTKLSMFRSNLHYFAKNNADNYDYIICDTQPSIAALVRAMLLVCHAVVMPINPDGQSLYAMASTFETINEIRIFNPELTAIVPFISKKTKRNIIINQISEQHVREQIATYQEMFKENISCMEHGIPDMTEITEQYLMGIEDGLTIFDRIGKNKDKKRRLELWCKELLHRIHTITDNTIELQRSAS